MKLLAAMLAPQTYPEPDSSWSPFSPLNSELILFFHSIGGDHEILDWTGKLVMLRVVESIRDPSGR